MLKALSFILSISLFGCGLYESEKFTTMSPQQIVEAVARCRDAKLEPVFYYGQTTGLIKYIQCDLKDKKNKDNLKN